MGDRGTSAGEVEFRVASPMGTRTIYKAFSSGQWQE